MIIAVELSDEDWRFVCEALEDKAMQSEGIAENCDDEGVAYELCIESVDIAKRIDGYITTLVGNALERSRPRFSDN